jgi:hypothetical protein
MYKYSPSTGGFYHENIHGDNFPEDAVEITDAEHLELMNGQGGGKEITPGPDGYPVLTSPPPPPVLTLEEKLANAGITVDELKKALGL